MARVAMVTREFTTTNATCKFFDIASTTITEKVIAIPANVDPEKVDNYIRKTYDNEKQRFIMVESTEKVCKLYGMTVETFLANSVELDPETRKILEK